MAQHILPAEKKRVLYERWRAGDVSDEAVQDLLDDEAAWEEFQSLSLAEDITVPSQTELEQEAETDDIFY